MTRGRGLYGYYRECMGGREGGRDYTKALISSILKS